MYRIEADGLIVYQPGDSLFSVTYAVLDEELGIASSFSFSIRPENPMYSKLVPLKTRIKVYDGGLLIFSGLIFEISKIGTDHTKSVNALDDLATLSLTQYTSGMGSSDICYGDIRPARCMEIALNCHNYQASRILPQIRKGNITAEGLPFDFHLDTSARSCLEAIRGMADEYGGYLKLREIGSSSGPILDWLKLEDCQTSTTADIQPVVFGENLREYERSESFDDYFTCLIPMGAMSASTGKRLMLGGPGIPPTIGGPDSLGRIKYMAKVWDNITDVETLQTTATEWYSAHCKKDHVSISITAADLSALGSGTNAWRLGDRARIIAEPYGIDTTMPIMKITTDLLHPEQRTITFSTASEMRERDDFTASIDEQITEAVKSGFTDSLYASSESIKDAAGIDELENRLGTVSTELESVKTDLDGIKSQLEGGGTGGGCNCQDWSTDIASIKERLDALEKKSLLDDLVGMVWEPIVFIDGTQFELGGSFDAAESGQTNGTGHLMVKAKLAKIEVEGQEPVYRWEWFIRAKSAKYIDRQINYLAEVFSPRVRIPIGQGKYLLIGDGKNYSDCIGESELENGEFMERGKASAIDSLVNVFSGCGVMYQPADTNSNIQSMVNEERDKDRYPSASNYYKAKARPAQFGWNCVLRAHPYRANPYYGLDDCQLDWHFYNSSAVVVSDNPSKLGTTDWEVSQ